MKFLFFPITFLGATIDNGIIRGVGIQKKGFFFHYTCTLEKVKPLYNKKKTPLFFKKKNLFFLTTGLSSNKLCIKTFNLKLHKKKDIDLSAPFLIEPHLPHSLENSIYCTTSKKKNPSKVTFSSTYKKDIHSLLNDYAKKKLAPDLISSHLLAIAFFNNLFQPPEIRAYIYRSASCSFVALVKDNEILSYRSFYTAVDIDKAIYALNHPEGEKTPKTLYLLGDCQTANLKELSNSFNLSENLPEISKEFAQIPLEIIKKYPIELGYALLGYSTPTNSLNFRQKEFSKKISKSSFNTILLPYVFLFFLLLSSTTLLCYKFLKTKESALIRQTQNLANITHELSGGGSEKIIFEGLNSFNLNGKVQDFLNQSEILFARHRSSFSYSPPYPVISEVLAHLNLISKNLMDENKTSRPVVQIDSFKYKMLKYPSEENPKQNYNIKVSFVLRAKSPKIARQFHEALLNSSYISKKREQFKWQFQNDKYHVSFMLLPRIENIKA